MGFSLFGKKKNDDHGVVFSDKTFMSTEAKWNACLELAIREPQSLFICWFPESARELRNLFSKQGHGETRVLEARNLHAGMLLNKTPYLAEHHPLHQKEIELVKNWGLTSITVFNSLEEPWFSYFGSERIISVMKALGMKEDESIEHPMISKSIVNAQEKIASKLVVEQTANSQAEWMLKNIGPKKS